MDYELIATLGPASAAEGIWRELIAAGASGFRLNTSHLSLEELQLWLDRLEAFFSRMGQRYPVVLDLQGSKWRLGNFSPFELQTGQRIELVYAEASSWQDTLPVPHLDFFQAAALSDGEIVLNDARSRLRVEAAGPENLEATVIQAGEISPRKGITFTHSRYRKETLNEKDRAIFESTRHLPSICYALSYLKDAAEMAAYRIHLDSSYLIAKLERQPAMVEALDIAARADELWVCRGDLGAELGLRRMAEAVRSFSTRLDTFSVPVQMAGQVLEHMTQSPTPTRSEVCYLYDCLAQGYRGFVLSDETAVGRYPVESCRMAALFRP